MTRMIRSEWVKLRRTVIWLLACVSPGLAVLVGLLGARESTVGRSAWLEALSLMAVLHAMLFLPLLTGVFAALVCRYEHVGGGWKQLLALPVSRSQIYWTKFAFVMLLLAISQLLFLAALLAIGAILGFAGPVPWEAMARSAVGGWVACLPLAALQLGVSAAWSSFAAPLALNVIFTLPNMLVANSADYGPYYPWAQPLLAMMPLREESFGAFNVSAVTLFGVIGASFVLFMAAGWTYFAKKTA